MAAVDHPSYREELQRCNYTLEYVRKSLETVTSRKERLDKEIEQLKKHFNSDNSQDYIDLTIKTLLQSSTDLKIRNLIAAMSKPYFARVDFREKGNSQ